MDFNQMFPIYLNVYIFTQIWMKLFSFDQIYLKLFDHTQLLLIYFNVYNFTQNLNTFLVSPNLMKAVGITTWSSLLKGSD